MRRGAADYLNYHRLARNDFTVSSINNPTGLNNNTKVASGDRLIGVPEFGVVWTTARVTPLANTKAPGRVILDG